ncbi:MAG: hypothetical protein KF718_05810 [Polyangiaceae bacterium]|nr:hypothetical protein [Polyangiaceae bacterium]
MMTVLAFALVGCGGDSEGGGGVGGQSDASVGGTAGSGGGTAGSGGGTAGSGGGTAGSGGGTAGSAGSGGSAGNCGSCDFSCCGSACINTDNDIDNCGQCGTKCSGVSPYCDKGVCKPSPPCASGTACIGTHTCCGTDCCSPTELCCNVPGPLGEQLGCATPVNGTCPKGCTSCICNSPDTPIATPSGQRAIAELKVGDPVYSVHEGQVRVVPVQRVARQAAPDHVVVQVRLASGAVLRSSPEHPTADGRTFGELRAGDGLDGVSVVEVRRVPYAHTHTYDILPASSTGSYYAGGVLIGSTLAPAVARSSGSSVAPMSW